MNGSVQLKNGMWYTVLSYKENNSYKKKWESTGLPERGNKKEASKVLEKRLKDFEQTERLKKEKYLHRSKSDSEPIGTADTPFVDYCKAFLKTKENKISPYVFNHYNTHYLKTFRDYFKETKIIDITEVELDGFNESLKKRNVSNTTLRHYADVIRPALTYAFKVDKIIPDNPFEKAKKIPKTKPLISFYNKAELGVLLEKIQGHELELAINMLVHYGMRRSELVGLRWKAIDFEHDTLTLNHKVLTIKKELVPSDILKSDSSYRTFPLIPKLKQMLLTQKEKVEENKKFFGNKYDYKWDDYTFVNRNGSLLRPDHLSHGFLDFLAKHELKHIRLHDLRHSCASLLLANKVNLKEIQDWLGHADFSTTANVYSHLDFSNKINSASILSDSLDIEKDIPIPKKESDWTDIQKTMTQVADAMKQLGITSLSEYMEVLESSLSSKIKLHESKNLMS